MTALYRVQQGLRALFAFSQTVDLPLAAEYLSPELFTLFEKMGRSEQLHSLNVLRDVLAQGSTPHHLAVAALLHDVGKSRYPLRTWQKTLVVLTRAIAPGLFKRWSKGNPQNFWLRPFVVYEQHPAWGSELIRAAGAAETAVWLVANHQNPAEQWSENPLAPLLRRLQNADNAN